MPYDKPIVCDVDGVLINVLDPFLEFHNRKYGTHVFRKDMAQYDLWPLLGVTKEEAGRRVMEFYKSSQFSNAKPVKGAQKAMRKIAPYTDTYCVTDRPLEIKGKTVQDLSMSFHKCFLDISFTNMLLDTKSGKKAQYCRDVGAGTMIEDCIDHARSCAKEGVKVLLMGEWNKSLDLSKETGAEIKLVSGWEEILELYENGKL